MDRHKEKGSKWARGQKELPHLQDKISDSYNKEGNDSTTSMSTQ